MLVSSGEKGDPTLSDGEAVDYTRVEYLHGTGILVTSTTSAYENRYIEGLAGTPTGALCDALSPPTTLTAAPEHGRSPTTFPFC